ncbi:hypothetical protein CHU98_g10286 [Xylaria longipes]|nr:hypothetical protein CHU98_g10286 [Xylaria longipes]
MVAADAEGKKASPLVALLAGGIAGGVEAACTYPFEFAKTRVQLYGHEGSRNPFAVVARVARQEGLRALYKGCSTMIVVVFDEATVLHDFRGAKKQARNATSRGISGSIGKDAVRFLMFDSIRSFFEDPVTHRLGTAQSIASGMLAGVVASTMIVTPTERIKTALIDDARTTQRFRSPWHCITVLYREQGFRGALYSGYVTTTLKQIGTTGFRLGTYSAIKDWERSKGIPVDGVLTSFANGAVAGTVTTLATQPFDTVKTKAQQAKRTGTMDSVRAIMAEDGIRGFWRGTVMRLGRTVMAGGILFTANEEATKMLKLILGQYPTRNLASGLVTHSKRYQGYGIRVLGCHISISSSRQARRGATHDLEFDNTASIATYIQGLHTFISSKHRRDGSSPCHVLSALQKFSGASRQKHAQDLWKLRKGQDRDKAYLDEQKSTTKLVSREHPDFEALQACFAKKPSVQPALIALPQTAEDVQILVRYCAQNKVEFVVCTGGHDSPGGTEEQDVLWIDMRDIDHVDVTSDKTTVKVGGGILFRGLTKALGEKGLVTPAATIANVGYVGWATLGGYGPFSALYGLGADQIVSAKVVNSKGELVEASDELLDCIIGGGGIFGVIVELTIKVYSLKEMSRVTWTPPEPIQLRRARNWLTRKRFEIRSVFQPFGITLIGSGMILFATATWGGQIKKATSGHGKVALLNNRGTKLSKSTRMPNYCEKNEKPVAREPQGRVCAMSFKRYASATVAVQARYPNLLLGGEARRAVGFY